MTLKETVDFLTKYLEESPERADWQVHIPHEFYGSIEFERYEVSDGLRVERDGQGKSYYVHCVELGNCFNPEDRELYRKELT